MATEETEKDDFAEDETESPSAASLEDRKGVTVEYLEPYPEGSSTLAEPYRLVENLVAAHHPDLKGANIGIYWRNSETREDADGFLEFGKVKLASDFDRSRLDLDFAFVIVHKVWHRKENTETNSLAMLDFLLCHCMPRKDKDGFQVEDEAGRLCWRLRKPLRVFPENVGRFGLWNAEKVADAIKRHKDASRPLLPKENGEKPGRRRNGIGDPAVPPGATSTVTPGGIAHNQRENEPVTAGKIGA